MFIRFYTFTDIIKIVTLCNFILQEMKQKKKHTIRSQFHLAPNSKFGSIFLSNFFLYNIIQNLHFLKLTNPKTSQNNGVKHTKKTDENIFAGDVCDY